MCFDGRSISGNEQRSSDAAEIASRLRDAEIGTLRARLDDHLFIELTEPAKNDGSTADDVIASVGRAAEAATGGRHPSHHVPPDIVEFWHTMLTNDVTLILADDVPAPTRHQRLFESVHRHLTGLAPDDLGDHDSQRVWMRYHAALARVEARRN